MRELKVELSERCHRMNQQQQKERWGAQYKWPHTLEKTPLITALRMRYINWNCQPTSSTSDKALKKTVCAAELHHQHLMDRSDNRWPHLYTLRNNIEFENNWETTSTINIIRKQHTHFNEKENSPNQTYNTLPTLQTQRRSQEQKNQRWLDANAEGWNYRSAATGTNSSKLQALRSAIQVASHSKRPIWPGCRWALYQILKLYYISSQR